MSVSQIQGFIFAFFKRVFVACLLSFVLGNVIAAESAKEGVQKAEMLMRVLTWVDWPTVNGKKPQDLTICLLGHFEEGTEQLTKLNNKVIDQKKLIVRVVKNLDASKSGCNLIYISSSESAESQAIISAYAGKPVLTLADIENFAKAGGSMNFTHINNKLGVTINLESMSKANLPLSSNVYHRMTIVPEESDLRN